MPLPILMIVASEDDGGMARVVYLLAKHLRDFDIEARVAVHREAPLADWLREAGIGVDVVADLIETPTRRRPDGRGGAGALAANLRGLPGAVRRIRELAGQHGSRILYSHNTWSHYVAAIAARRRDQGSGIRDGAARGTQPPAPGTRIPVVWHIHNDHSRPLTRLVDRAAMRLGDVAAVLAVSKSIGEPFERSAAPLTVVPNGIERAAFDAAASVPSLRAPLGLAAGDIVVVYAGRLVAHKGIHVLLAAARAAIPQVPRLHVVVLGGTPRHAGHDVVGGLRSQVESWGLADRVHFPGHVAQVERYVADADVAVVPSTCADGCPLAAIEALCLGVPVIGSAIGGLPEIVEDGVDGVLVPAGDVRGLAEALVSLARQPERRRAMGAAARRAARDRFDAVRMARQAASVLHGVANTACQA